MNVLHLSIGEPFTSPAWGANFMVFSCAEGACILEDAATDYLARACRYAEHHKVYLVPERFILKDYHSMCLISPEGTVIGAQKAVFRNLSGAKTKRSGKINVLETEFGNIFLCVDVDIYHPEVPRIAKAMGASYLICSQFISEHDYNAGMVTQGVWNASQCGGMFVVGVSNQYNCVCAPRRLTPNDDGFVVTPRLKMPIRADMRAEQLTRLPEREYLPRKFYNMHRDDICG